MKLSIIIVNYNTKKFLDKCLESVYASSLEQKEYETIVVDNASGDNSVAELSNKYEQVHWIGLKKNVGFAKANNIGIRKSNETDFLLFLNPDTILETKALQKMLFFADNKLRLGILTPYLKLPDGQIDDACHRGFPTPWNALCHFTGLAELFPNSMLFNGYHLAYRNLDNPHEIDACAGAAMLVRRSCGEEIGWWDEDYFWYGEDLDFCYRAKQARWKVYFYPHTKVLHYKGVSAGIKDNSVDITTADIETRRKAQAARFDAMQIFYKKHYQTVYLSIINSLVLYFIEVMKRYRQFRY